MVSAPVVISFNSGASAEFTEALNLSKRTKQKLDKILLQPSDEDAVMDTIHEVKDSKKSEIKVNNMRQATTYSLESESSQSERIMVSLESADESEKSVSETSEGQ